jgi:hypothetical protein
MVVAAEHCAWMMSLGSNSRQALNAIGLTQPKKAGWGVAQAHYAQRWIAMQTRNQRGAA